MIKYDLLSRNQLLIAMMTKSYEKVVTTVGLNYQFLFARRALDAPRRFQNQRRRAAARRA